jgi:hypothetical protein
MSSVGKAFRKYLHATVAIHWSSPLFFSTNFTTRGQRSPKKHQDFPAVLILLSKLVFAILPLNGSASAWQGRYFGQGRPIIYFRRKRLEAQA